MLVLTYCAGLRLGELARLNLADIDLQVGTITIRETKFFKSRILPLADSPLSALPGISGGEAQGKGATKPSIWPVLAR
ncbi:MULTISPECIES: tyrosine-type recombinase/integrase [unclassified Bradyrhizobium]|uniref:tyrosine-type recombinase/integrase n=1 Tax=unclassified Bradyrhizobium TaxID=2631580 RepID=UPI001FF99264|nr:MULTISPECIES: tyrosine-type recombinase/integrase [unclassified Bradyrhizobium]